MAYSVQKPFNTANRRFAVGAKVEAVDLAADQLPLSVRLAKGFIKDDAAPAKAKAPAASA